MTKNELNEKYFKWMYQLVCNGKCTKGLSYQKLLKYLHSIDFNYVLAMDGNRAEDGIALRYRFGYTFSYKQSMIGSLLDTNPCSILEMMVALAVRCEEDIMGNPDDGYRVDKWFWGMLDSLGLLNMDDYNINYNYIDSILFKFMNNKYKPNGKGGLFTIKNCNKDLRTIEIWYQMNLYLNDKEII